MLTVFQHAGLWLYSDLEKLAHRAEQFQIAAIYGEEFEEIEDMDHVSGEH